MGPSIGMIIIWFGRWPSYLDLFLHSCAGNEGFRWYIFSDNQICPDHPDNVSFEHMETAEFEQSVREKTGMELELDNPYKLCDFKPLYGQIFEDLLGSYDYWGYCDLDVIFGDLKQFLSDLIPKFDVISAYEGFMSGPFALFRTTRQTMLSYRHCPHAETILSDPEYQGFDENIQRPEIMGTGIRKILLFIRFFMKTGLNADLKDFRYRYHWFVKRFTTDPSAPADFTEAVWAAQKQGRLRAGFFPLLITDPYFSRIRKPDWSFRYEKGKLSDLRTGKEVMALHFQEAKKSNAFWLGKGDRIPASFIISSNGVSDADAG